MSGFESDVARMRRSFGIARSNSAAMLKRLEAFETKLEVLGCTIRPLQDSTAQYSLAYSRISATVKEMHKTFDLFRIADETKIAIKRSFGAVRGNETLEAEFCRALGRLSESRRFFQSQSGGEMKAASSVLVGINKLYGLAVKDLLQELHKSLQLGSAVAAFSAASGKDDDAVKKLSESLKDIQKLGDLLERNDCLLHIDSYREARVCQLQADLKGFEERYLPMLATLPTALEQMPYKQSDDLMGAPLGSLLGFCVELLHAETELWATALHKHSPQALAALSSICGAVVAELQRVLAPLLEEDTRRSGSVLLKVNLLLARLDAASNLLTCSEALSAACEPEQGKACSVSLTVKALRDALVEACSESLSAVLLETAARASSSVNALPALATKGGGDAADAFVGCNAGEACELQPVTVHTLQVCIELSRSPDAFAEVAMHASGIGLALPASVVQLQSSSGAPPQARYVHALLTNLVDSIEQRAGQLRAAVGAAVAAVANFDSGSGAGARAKALAAAAAASVAALAAAASTPKAVAANRLQPRRPLESRLAQHSLFDRGDREAEGAVAAATAALYLCNNLWPMSSILLDTATPEGPANKAGRAALLRCLPPALGQDVRARLTVAQTEFCDAVASALGVSDEDMASFNQLYSGAVGSREKGNPARVLKAKFSLFTSGMDALLGMQGIWRVASPRQRAELSASLVRQICPVYEQLYATYSPISFSKTHRQEYLRFSPNQVQAALQNLFGG